MRILVAGGLGFLGGRIARHFVDEGHEVLRGTRREISPDDVVAAHGPLVCTPLTELEQLKTACAGVDVVIKASGMNARECAADPLGAIEVNTIATAAMLQAAIEGGVRRFIYISTVHVYTDRLEGTITEDYCPSNIHPYATSNRAAEDVVLAAHRAGRIDGIVIRLSNGYGVPVDPAANCWMLLVNDLCRQAAETGKIALASNGLQARNFISIKEVCGVMDFLAGLPPAARNADVGPINVGSRVSQTVLEMAKQVQARCAAVLGFSLPLTVGSGSESERPATFDYRTDRLLSLGYVYRFDPNEEIDDLLRYCRDEFSGRA